MKTIILAIDGKSPRSEAAKYALGLAQRLKARLSILQVIKPAGKNRRQGLTRMIKKGARLLENAMVTATYAEAGEHDLAESIRAMMAEAARSMETGGEAHQGAVDYDVTVAVGDMTEEVVRFVDGHKDAVIAIYDGPPKKSDHFSKRLLDQVSIPMVSLEKR